MGMSRLIDADALIDDMEKRYCKDCERRKGVKGGKVRMLYEIGEAPCRACGTMDAMDEIDNAPTIETEPVRHGRWVNRGKDLEAHSMEVFDAWSCSRCRYYIHGNGYPKWKYCPMCGCRMKEAE